MTLTHAARSAGSVHGHSSKLLDLPTVLNNVAEGAVVLYNCMQTNVGKTASSSILTLFKSRYTLKGRYNIGNFAKLVLYAYAYSL